MWYLIEDFFEQSWIMKLFIMWGWVSIVIMVASFAQPIVIEILARLHPAAGT